MRSKHSVQVRGKQDVHSFVPESATLTARGMCCGANEITVLVMTAFGQPFPARIFIAAPAMPVSVTTEMAA